MRNASGFPQRRRTGRRVPNHRCGREDGPYRLRLDADVTEIETRTTVPALDQDARAVLFSEAHTTNTFTSEPVDPDLVRRVYEDVRWAPTSMNIQPLRMTVLADREIREEVVTHLWEANRAKTSAAPLSLVVAYDPDWHEHLPHLAPHRTGARETFADHPDRREAMARQNTWLQLGYLILGLRAHGLHVGPMVGLDAAGVDSVVHRENGWRTLCVVNVGHAPDPEDPAAQRPRAGRLEFDQACQVL